MKYEPSASKGAMPPSTPPPVAFEGPVRYASFWVRLIAFILDLILIFIAYVFLILGYTLLSGDSRLVDIYMAEESPYDWVVILLDYTFTALFIVLFWVFCHGATPGKMAFGIYIQDSRTRKEASWHRLCLRFIGYGLSGVLLLGGFLLAAFHPRKQALHDLISGTIVVYRDPG